MRLWVGSLLMVASLAFVNTASGQESRPFRTDRSRIWMLGGAALGYGSGPFDGFYGVLSASVMVWPFDNVGVNAVAAKSGSGAPDGPGAEGAYLGAGLSFRAPLDDSQNPWWIFSSVSAGSAHVSGYGYRSDPETNFDYRDFILSVRVGFVGSLGPVTGGLGGVYDTMPGHGYAVAIPSLFGGLAF